MLRPKAIHVEPQDNYTLLITFSNQERKLFDVAPYLDWGPFVELKNPTLFRTVKPAGLSIEWIHGQDICPDELYDNSTLVS
ncbi:DUF2442 domain-containing protein [Bengtsoniella intestinalis]|uniref:DUF2442 domain-containing protein n=1 Tax=Bengtsoniella intestinalis TaxID=3073143 RepID=UPI00391EE25B